MSENGEWSEFTETGFRKLVRHLKAENYAFVSFEETVEGRHVLWRHDVDISMHRAAKLAAIEAEEGVQATYFLNPRCAYYNLAEPEMVQLARAISQAGHYIGLHFDAGVLKGDAPTYENLQAAVALERRIVEDILELPLKVMSWHDPEVCDLMRFDENSVAGLVNAYSGRLRKQYVYASDSNGFWRFRPMSSVIADGHERLHLLTHPEWWTPDPLPPYARLERALKGRSDALRSAYNTGLAEFGRPNIGHSD